MARKRKFSGNAYKSLLKSWSPGVSGRHNWGGWTNLYIDIHINISIKRETKIYKKKKKSLPGKTVTLLKVTSDCVD